MRARFLSITPIAAAALLCSAAYGQQAPAQLPTVDIVSISPLPGLGVAVHYSFVTYVAAEIEVAVDAKGGIAITRADIAVDCGAMVNPDRVVSQMEGDCINGLRQALMSEITFKDGRAQQDNYHQYLIARMNEAPKKINVHLIAPDFSLPLGGVGEPGVPPIAPALCNAIAAATGKRIRQLPIGDQLASKA